MKKKIIAIGLLALIFCIVIRIPTTPHEKGTDGFEIDILSNSIKDSGYIKWLLSPLSLFGLYPLGTNVGLPILLAQLSILTGTNQEFTVLISSTIFSIIAFIGIFTLSKEITNELLPALVSAFAFCVFPVLISLNQWNSSSRFPFLAVYPIFLWSLIKITQGKHLIKFIIISAILFLVAGALHRMIFFSPITILSLLIASIITKAHKKNTKKVNNAILLISILIICLVISLSVPLISQNLSYKFTSTRPYNYFNFLGSLLPLALASFYLFGLGPIIILIILGSLFLILKQNKTTKEYFLIISIACSFLLIVEIQYSAPVAMIFYSILAGYGAIYLSALLKNKKILILSAVFLIGLIIIHNMILVVNQKPTSNPTGTEAWLQDDLLSVANFFKLIAGNSTIAINEGITVPQRFSAISGIPFAIPPDRTYLAYYDSADVKVELEDNINIIRNPSVFFKVTKPTLFRDKTDVMYYSQYSPRFNELREEYDINYVLENLKIKGMYSILWGTVESGLLTSLESNGNVVYSNNRYRLWQIK